MSYFEKLKPLVSGRPFELERPKVIQFPVIDICNSRCQMCRIWQNKKSNDITSDQLRVGLSNSLFSEVTGIGFNGGEPTLRKDLPELVQVAVDCLPNLKNISLITNAYNYQDVIDHVAAIGAITKSNNVYFDLMVSLDGYGEVHDLVRGKPGNFARAQHVISYAKKSNVVDNLRIGCTVIRANVNHLGDLHDYCVKNNLYVKYRLGVPHQRLYTQDLVDPYALTQAEKFEFVEFLEGVIKNYEKGYLQNHFYRSLIAQIVNHAPRRAGCDWQHRGATITAKGELAYCAVKSKVLLNDISVGNPEAAYFSNKEHLKQIVETACDDCSHDYVGIPNRGDYFRLVLSLLNERFGLKSRMKRFPGFSSIQSLRSKSAFNRYKTKFADLPVSIRLVPTDSEKSKRIMICGWYGTETLGDKAIVAGVIDSLRKIYGSDVSLTVASLFPYVTRLTKEQMPEFKDVNVIDLNEAIRTISNYNCLLFGGGPLMAINELAPMTVLFERAKKSNVVTVAAGVGVGPLGKEWLNNAIGHILKVCDFRIYRDRKSLELAGSLGVDVGHDVVAEDPALTWLKKIRVWNENKDRSSTKVKTLLLGLRDFPFREYAADLKEQDALAIKDNFEKSIVKALENLVAHDKEWIIKPLPMCTNHFGGDDRWFYRRLFRDCDSLKEYLDYSLLGREFAPAEYVQSFQHADVLLGMRFHSIVFGLGLGVKTVAIDYTMGRGKVTSLSDRFGVDAISMVDISSKRILDAVVAASKQAEVQFKNICDDLTFEGSLRTVLCEGDVR